MMITPLLFHASSVVQCGPLPNWSYVLSASAFVRELQAFLSAALELRGSAVQPIYEAKDPRHGALRSHGVLDTTSLEEGRDYYGDDKFAVSAASEKDDKPPGT
eukprot:1394502-Amphidinium_carterae.1